MASCLVALTLCALQLHLTGDARLEFLRNSGPAPQMRKHGARGPVGYQPTTASPNQVLIHAARGAREGLWLEQLCSYVRSVRKHLVR